MDAVLTGKGISVAYQQNIIIPSMDVEIPRGLCDVCHRGLTDAENQLC